jgi:threonine dehydrogenase-like Zn-dependent dehydrogenase
VYTALHKVGAFNAESVVVLGAGFCGQIACLLMKRFGVRQVCLVDVNKERLNFALNQGFADMDLNPLTDLDTIERMVTDTQGAFADIVFDALPGIHPAGLPDTRNLGARLLRPEGTWAMYSASQTMMMPTLTLLAKGISVKGAAYCSSVIGFPQRARQMRVVYDLVRAGFIPVGRFISRSVDFFDEAGVIEAIRNYGQGPDLKIEIRRS